MPEAKVIFINRVYWPSTAATAQLLTDLAEGLASRGWPVHVITSGTGDEKHNGVNIHRTGTNEQHGGLFSRALTHRAFVRTAERQLAALAGPGDIAVPMTDPPMLGVAMTRPAMERGARVVHWIQDIYPEIAAIHFGALARIFLSPLKARRSTAWRAATACVTLGEDMAQTVAQQGVSPGQITLIPNWAPRELQTPASPVAIAECRARWGLAGKFVAAYSGNLGRVHEFETVLQAAGLLRNLPDVVFLFIGKGARFDEIRATASSRGLDNVRLLPPEPRESLAAALAAADAHFVTLRPDYATLVYPSKLAGALAASRPVLFVGPPKGDIARLLDRENCGVTLAPGDATGLARTVTTWQAEARLRAQLGANARTAAGRHFDFSSALARWEELLTSHRSPRKINLPSRTGGS